MDLNQINNEFGDIDLFLMDLLLRGMVSKKAKILDAGCGSGRNLFYFLNNDFHISAIDNEPIEVKATNFLSRSLGKGDVCIQGSIGEMPYPSDYFDLVICSRVLHFARNDEDFFKSISELRRVLSPTGTLYLTIDSAIGMEGLIQMDKDGRGKFPDGTERYLLNDGHILKMEEAWEKTHDIRTVIYDKIHGETTLILRKRY